MTLSRYSYSIRSRNQKERSSSSQPSNVRDLLLESRQRRYTGTYKSPYYDPVERHERYMRERSSLGIGVAKPSIGSGSSSGRSSSGGKGKSGKGGKSGKVSKARGGRGNSSAMSAEIQKLREESSLNTDAQREATRRKIEDLKTQLREQVEKLSGADKESSLNVAEIRGNIQSIRKQIEDAGGNLQDWISNEKDSLEKRIAAIYKANGKKYNVTSKSDKENASKARDKEVKSRADSVYKSKYKK